MPPRWWSRSCGPRGWWKIGRASCRERVWIVYDSADFSSRRRHTRWPRDWSSDVCSSDLETLVEYGFRLPSALDNRPLRFDEWEQLVPQVIFVSATPGPYEEEHAAQVVEQVVRPTGLVEDRKSTRLNSSHVAISYAVLGLK